MQSQRVRQTNIVPKLQSTLSFDRALKIVELGSPSRRTAAMFIDESNLGIVYNHSFFGNAFSFQRGGRIRTRVRSFKDKLRCLALFSVFYVFNSLLGIKKGPKSSQTCYTVMSIYRRCAFGKRPLIFNLFIWCTLF